MKKHIISKILIIISIIILVVVSVLTMHLAISYSQMIHTEGTGLIAALVYFLGSISIVIISILNIIAFFLQPNISKKDKETRKNIIPLIIILLSITIYIVELNVLHQ